jgi:hypothetical protein
MRHAPNVITTKKIARPAPLIRYMPGFYLLLRFCAAGYSIGSTESFRGSGRGSNSRAAYHIE